MREEVETGEIDSADSMSNQYHQRIGAYLHMCQFLDFSRCRNDDDAERDGET